ncbi:hypothetical protein EPO15_12740 [bacterium]|nr:MAG: hypothetical protein EPO15_12740 [bacterium]
MTIPFRFHAKTALPMGAVCAFLVYALVPLHQAVRASRGAPVEFMLEAVVALLLAFAAYMLLGCLGIGHEAVWREGEELVVRYDMRVFRWTVRYAVGKMGPVCCDERLPAGATRLEAEGGALRVHDDDSELRPSAPPDDQGKRWAAGRQTAGVYFEYAGPPHQVVRIGLGLDAGQALRLADILRTRLGLP